MLGREEREPSPTSRSIPDDEKSTLQKLEELLVQIEAEITPTEGLNSTIADVRRVIDKAFAARNAFRVQVSGLVAESNESSATEVTEIRVAPQQSAANLEQIQVSGLICVINRRMVRSVTRLSLPHFRNLHLRWIEVGPKVRLPTKCSPFCTQDRTN